MRLPESTDGRDAGSSPLGTLRSALANQLGEDHGVVVVAVTRGVEQRQGALTPATAQLGEALDLTGQLVQIA